MTATARPETQRRGVADVGWALGGRLGVMAGSMAINVVLAATMDPAVLGVFFLAITLGTWLSILMQGGLHNLVLRAVGLASSSGDDVAARRLTTSALLAVLIAAGVLGPLLLIPPVRSMIGAFGGFEFPFALGAAVAAYAATRAFQSVANECLRARGDLRRASLLGSTGSLFGGPVSTGLTLMAVLAMAALSADSALSPTSVLAVAASFSAATNLWALHHLQVRGATVPSPVRRSLALYRQSRTLLVTSVLLNLRSTVDLWLVAALALTADVGRYGFAAKLALAVGVPLALANAVLPPRVNAHLVREDRRAVEALLRASATLSLALASVVSLAVFLLAGLVTAQLGSDYDGVLLPLGLLLAARLIDTAFGPCAQGAVLLGHEGALLPAMTLGLAATVVVGWSLGATLGPAGVACGVVAGTFLQNVLTARALWIRSGIRSGPTIMRADVSAGTRLLLNATER